MQPEAVRRLESTRGALWLKTFWYSLYSLLSPVVPAWSCRSGLPYVNLCNARMGYYLEIACLLPIRLNETGLASPFRSHRGR
jgi:hypothetical protein